MHAILHKHTQLKRISILALIKHTDTAYWTSFDIMKINSQKVKKPVGKNWDSEQILHACLIPEKVLQLQEMYLQFFASPITPKSSFPKMIQKSEFMPKGI